ncbi:MAG TPA: hypothetical protein VNA20_04765 [Frankiaceae bacterium]|nr:hypothetical protein [Frankiaceae bacterium]
MKRVLSATMLAAAALATVAAPASAAESCQAGRTQVMCQTGRCTGEGGCQIWYCVVWTKGVCVG